MAYEYYERMLPGLAQLPGYRPMIVLTPENYARMDMARRPSQWPAVWLGLRAIQNVQDLFKMDAQARNVDTLIANINLTLGIGIGTADVQAAAGPEGDADHLRTQIVAMYEGIYDFWKAGIWQGVGTAWAGAVEDMILPGQMLYAYKTLMYHTAITPRMRRHWNRKYTPEVPDAQMAYSLCKRGKITWDQFLLYASYDGWNEQGAKWLSEVWTEIPTVQQAISLYLRGKMTWDAVQDYVVKNGWTKDWAPYFLELATRLPSPQEAFYMQNRGLISTTERNTIYRAWGWDSDWYDKITANFAYAPTVYDLMRLADYVELDQIWTLDKLAKRGVEEKDRAKIWEALQLRPLADERKALTTKWTWRRRMGRATEQQLSDQFTTLGIRSKEKELLIEKANLDYEDELIDEWVQILIWRFRTAVITEEDFRQDLLDLGINEEKSNLIVELEKAMGYFGYY